LFFIAPVFILEFFEKLIVCEEYIPRPLGHYKGMYPETNTLSKQHISSFRARLLILRTEEIWKVTFAGCIVLVFFLLYYFWWLMPVAKNELMLKY
jgi:hypothetical protein